MNLLSYDQMRIKVVKADRIPGAITKLACDHTMLKNVDLSNGAEANRELLAFLVKAEHTSVLEHCSITFAISGVSRSLLAQITRQRMATITSQSQHYQDYSDAPMVVHQDLKNDSLVEQSFFNSLKDYQILIKEENPREEARQVLPNAAAVNILWTINARSLMLFLRQRCCRRNVAEMVIFADRIREFCNEWWPELFRLAGPPCIMDRACNQGVMKAESCK